MSGKTNRRAVLVMAVLFVGFGCAITAGQVIANSNVDTEIGTHLLQLAPDFTLADIDGGAVTLSELRGRDILLVFGNTHCPHCAEQIPLLNELDAESNESGFKVIFIAMGDTPSVVRKYIKDRNVKFEVLLDTNRSVGRAYGVRKVPEAFIVGSDGLIQYSGPKQGPAIWYVLEGREIPEAVLTAMETNDGDELSKLAENCESEYAGIIDDCEKRAPYLIYQHTVVVKPNRAFSIPVHVDFSDCPESKKNYYIDFDADGIYEVTGQIERDYFLIEGNFQREGNHPVKGKVEGTYGTTPFLIDVYVTKQEITPRDVRKQLYPDLYRKRPERIKAQGTGDGIRKKRAVLFLGSSEERFWIDINLAYHVLQDKYNFTDDEIILYTYNSNVPASLTDFDPNWIDGTAFSSTSMQEVFSNLASDLDGDDWLFFVFDGHGSGYYGPRTRRPYYPKSPDSIYEGPINPYEYDDPDYREDEFQTEFIPSGQVNCVKYDYVPKGLDTFVPCFTYYTSHISEGDTYYRFMVSSHFENLPLIDDSLLSDNDIYIEKIISYARCDLNRNTIIEANEINLCDWDGDGYTLTNPFTKEYDEDDWFDKFTAEENYHPYHKINGQYYCYFDKNLDNTLDMMGFESDSDPLYLDCLAGQADPNDLVATASDTDNNGYANYLDINLDGDLEDYLSFDETLSYGYSIDDDEFTALFSMIDPNTTKLFLTESCFSGGFLRDLSYLNVISMSASEEDDTSSGNYFIRQFFMGLNKGCELFGCTGYCYDCNISWYSNIEQNLDLDADQLISIAEAFRKSYEANPVDNDFPMIDDNGDLNESYGDELTFIHELSYSVGKEVPEGIYADSIVLDPNFYGDINEVTCYDFDGPLNFAGLSKIVNYGEYHNDYNDAAGIVDYVCDGRIDTRFNYNPADFDIDGDIDFEDFVVLAGQWLHTGEALSADIFPYGGNSIVNHWDLDVFVKYWLASILPPITGDYNDDYIVNFIDFAKLAKFWQQNKVPVDIAPPGGDDVANFLDLEVLTDNWLAGK